MIPRTVHQIWLQGGNPPEPLATYVRGVGRICGASGWSWQTWRESDVALLSSASRATWQTYAPLCCHRSQTSNLLRYLVLLERGGLYLDTDVELFRLPEDLHGAWIVATNNRTDRLSNGVCVNPAVLACAPDHPFLRRIVGMFPFLDWDKHLSAGSQLAGRCLRSDVSIWPMPSWHGGWHDRNYNSPRPSGARAYGHHRGLGTRADSFKPYPPQPGS